jgi:hypothetical protein
MYKLLFKIAQRETKPNRAQSTKNTQCLFTLDWIETISRSYLGFKHNKWRIRTDGSIKGRSLRKCRQLVPFKIYHRHITSNHTLDCEGYQKNDSQPPPTGNEKKRTLK